MMIFNKQTDEYVRLDASALLDEMLGRQATAENADKIVRKEKYAAGKLRKLAPVAAKMRVAS